MFKKINILFGLVIAVFAIALAVQAAQVGQKMTQVKLLTLKTVNGKEVWTPDDIPQIGSKVVTIMYTDVDDADMNDPLSDAIKQKDYPKDKYLGIGIANSKDAPWKPDAFIRIAVKKKLKKYVGSVILLDEDRSFSKGLQLGDCNGKAVVFVVDKDGTIKYMKKISSKQESVAMTPEVLALMDSLLK